MPDTSTDTSTSPRLPFTLLDQHAWSEAIGRKVSREFGFRKHSQERDDLIGVAVLMVCELYERPVRGTWDAGLGKWIEKGFNLSKVPPGGSAEGLFRGWAYAWAISKCRRAVAEMGGGGTFRTTRPENRPGRVVALGELAEGIADVCVTDNREDISAPRRPVASTITDDLSTVSYGRRLARSLCGEKRTR